MQNVGQCRNGDDEHKRISFAVIITITQSLKEKKDNPCSHKNTMAFVMALMTHTLIACRRKTKDQNYKKSLCVGVNWLGY